MRIFTQIVVLLTSSVLLIYTEEIRVWLTTETGLKWFNAFLLPRLAYAFLAIAFSIAVCRVISKKPLLRGLTFLLVLGVAIVVHVLLYKPFADDWVEMGSNVADDSVVVPIEEYIIHTQTTGFTGVACLALAGCEYCHNTIGELKLIKNRNPNIDVAVFVFAIDSSEVKMIEDEVRGYDIMVSEAPAPDTTFRITYGNFPTLLLIENGTVVHRWFYSEFGYPAKDRIESAFKASTVVTKQPQSK